MHEWVAYFIILSLRLLTWVKMWWTQFR
jgi:hypothetical protein